MEAPREDDLITNEDESKRLPDENPEPLTGTKKEEHDIIMPEHKGKTDDKPASDEKVPPKPESNSPNNLT